MQPSRASGASTPTPLAPDVWTTMVPGRTADVAASPDTRPASSLSGTASSNSSAPAATSGGVATGVSDSRRRARCRDAWEMALHATTTWSARSSATPRAVPTRPAEMIPTLSRAGRKPSSCTIADDLTDILFRSGPTWWVPFGHYDCSRLPGITQCEEAPSSAVAATSAAALGGLHLQAGQQIGHRLASSGGAFFGAVGVLLARVTGVPWRLL